MTRRLHCNLCWRSKTECPIHESLVHKTLKMKQICHLFAFPFRWLLQDRLLLGCFLLASCRLDCSLVRPFKLVSLTNTGDMSAYYQQTSVCCVACVCSHPAAQCLQRAMEQSTFAPLCM